jgi:hypothetical protein
MDNHLQRKLDPALFRNMSLQMAAILGFLFERDYTTPALAELVVPPDGHVLARPEGGSAPADLASAVELRANLARFGDVGGARWRGVEGVRRPGAAQTGHRARCGPRGTGDVSAMPAAYRAIIDPLVATAREILEGGESLVPFAFVGNLTTKETYPVVLNTGSDGQKDDSALLIRHVARRVEADFVFVIMDAWALPPDKMHRYEEILERYGSVAASPYRIDVVSFALETRHGLWVAQVPVKP